MTTRQIYNRCYQAFRDKATFEVRDLWRDHHAIYRAAANSYIDSGYGNYYQWLNQERQRGFSNGRLHQIIGWLQP